MKNKYIYTILVFVITLLSSCEDKNKDKLSFFFGNESNSTETPTTKDYKVFNSITSNNYKSPYVLSETFDNYSNDWDIDNDTTGNYYIVDKFLNTFNGYYQLSCSDPDYSGISWLQLSSWNPTNNFEMTVILSQTYNASATYPYVGISFGWDYSVTFGINGQTYSIAKFENTSSLDWVSWTSSSSINSYGNNTLTVRRINNTLYFFINSVYVYSQYDSTFTSNDDVVAMIMRECTGYYYSIYVKELINL
jgi:hypothetical protein